MTVSKILIPARRAARYTVVLCIVHTIIDWKQRVVSIHRPLRYGPSTLPLCRTFIQLKKKNRVALPDRATGRDETPTESGRSPTCYFHPSYDRQQPGGNIHITSRTARLSEGTGPPY
ncbi:hypothetical protein Q1695_004507 [Nippostrongylus brasiliensis]|nr:hypothetical protein Q1695_004507 [Nippostrongylus brasiliensis]